MSGMWEGPGGVAWRGLRDAGGTGGRGVAGTGTGRERGACGPRANTFARAQRSPFHRITLPTEAALLRRWRVRRRRRRPAADPLASPDARTVGLPHTPSRDWSCVARLPRGGGDPPAPHAPRVVQREAVRRTGARHRSLPLARHRDPHTPSGLRPLRRSGRRRAKGGAVPGREGPRACDWGVWAMNEIGQRGQPVGPC